MRASTAVFAAVLLFLPPTAADAQIQALHVGVGFTNASASFDGDGTEVAARSGFNLGIGAEIPLGDGPLIFLPELQFSQEGAKFVTEGGFGGEPFEATTRMNYLRLPAVVGYRTGNGDGVRPTVYAGPNVGVLLGCTDEFDSESYDCGDEKKTLDLGATVGGGLDFPVGSQARAGFEARYNLGLTSILSDSDVGEKNRNWQVRGKVSMPIGGA